MIFCKLKSVENGFGVYYYGDSPERMTGVVRFSKDGESYSIEQIPENGSSLEKWIVRIQLKYRDELKSENYPGRMAVQIG